MASFANNYVDKLKLYSLRADLVQPFSTLLAEAESFYSAKLVNLNPNDFKTIEEFARKWQYYRGCLDAIQDLQLILRGNNK